jgi:hypothetical protein
MGDQPCCKALWLIICFNSVFGLLHRMDVALSRHLAEGTEETQENFSRVSRCSGRNSIEYFPNESLAMYRYTNPLTLQITKLK